MGIDHTVFSFLALDENWSIDWAWASPLIVLTVLIHVLGLVFINRKVDRTSVLRNQWQHPTAILVMVMVMGSITLLVTILHGIEAAVWAAAYRYLGALSDIKSAMLYSLNAITSYGHTNLRLEDHWHLMGSLEALKGWLLFGLTTAFLFAMIQKFISPRNKVEHG